MMNQFGFLLNIITLSIDIFTCLISLIIFITIINYRCHNHIKQEDKITFILCINIYPLTMVYTALMVLTNIQTLLGDLYGHNSNSSLCVFLGYFSTVLLSMLYWAFVNQAFYRLCRIVYTTYIWLQSSMLYIMLPFIELILICILLSPVLFWHDIIYLPKENYCFVTMTNVRGVLWLLLNAFLLPVSLLPLIYLRITKYLRQQYNYQTYIVQQRQKRDLLVIRRILITAGLLVALGIPSTVLAIILFITGEEHPLFMRIEFCLVSITLMGECLSMVIITPQLKNIIIKKI